MDSTLVKETTMATELSEHRGLDSGSAPHHQDAVAKQSQALPKIPLPTSTLLLHSKLPRLAALRCQLH